MSFAHPLDAPLQVIGQHEATEAAGTTSLHLQYMRRNNPGTYVDVEVTEFPHGTVVTACGPFAVGQAVEKPAPFEMKAIHNEDPSCEIKRARLIQDVVQFVFAHGNARTDT